MRKLFIRIGLLFLSLTNNFCNAFSAKPGGKSSHNSNSIRLLINLIQVIHVLKFTPIICFFTNLDEIEINTSETLGASECIAKTIKDTVSCY